MSRSCFPRWTKPRRFRPVGRCRSGSSTSRTDRCERAASIVMRTSQPKPAATGKQARRAAGDRARWPDRGSRTSKPAEDFDQGSGDSFREPEASPLTLCERRDVEIAAAVEEWRELSREICIAEEQRAGRGSALGCGQRLALSPTWEPQDDRTCGLGCVCRAVARAVVGHDHLGVGKRPPQGRDGRPDDVFLVARGDEDRQRLIHRPPVGAAVRSAAAAAFLPSCRSRRSTRGRRARR